MICQTLISFARQREKAYRFTGTFTGTRAKAISHIIRVADFCKGRDEASAIRQSSEQLLAILPPRSSRYQKQRNEILTLLQTYL